MKFRDCVVITTLVLFIVSGWCFIIKIVNNKIEEIDKQSWYIPATMEVQNVFANKTSR